MERLIITGTELTGATHSAYSNGRGIFMPEGNVSPEDGSQRSDERITEPSIQESSARVTHRVRETDPAVIEEKFKGLVERYRQIGIPIDADMLQTLRIMAQEGIMPIGGGSGEGEEAEEGRSRGRGREKSPSELKKEIAAEFDTLTPPSQFTNTELRRLAEKLETLRSDSTRKNDPDLYREIESRLSEIIQTGNLDEATGEEVRQVGARLGIVKRLTGIDEAVSVDEARYTFRLSLTESDFEDLDQDPMDWMDRQIDRVYEFSRQGQEINSPFVSAAQHLVENAQRYLINTKWGKKDPELIQKFSYNFQMRLNTMFLRSTNQRRNLEGSQGLSQQIGVRGILSTLTLEKGLVGQMHNRMAEVIEDMRVRAPEHHITPEMESQIQNKLIVEFQILLQNGVEIGTPSGADNKSTTRVRRMQEAAIRRAVGAAYDHLVASQREAVLVARGDALPLHGNLRGIAADPSGLFMIYNYEQLLIAKFGLLQHEEQEFFSALKRMYAENVLRDKDINIDEWVHERVRNNLSLSRENEHETREAALVDYGQSLMRDLLAVNDFYSAPWRLEAFIEQIGDVIRYNKAREAYQQSNRDEYDRLNQIIIDTSTSADDKADARRTLSKNIGRAMSQISTESSRVDAKDFGLFMQLRVIHKNAKLPPLLPADQAIIDSMVARGESEDKISSEKQKLLKIDIWKRIAAYRPEDVVKLYREKTDSGDAYTHELARVNRAFENIGLTSADPNDTKGLYDAFKDKYGAALRLVREKGFDNLEQVNFANLNNPEYIKLFNKAMGLSEDDRVEIKKIKYIFRVMSKFAGSDETIGKLLNDSRFEYVYNRTYAVDDALLDKLEFVDEVAGITPLSSKITPEAGADAFARSYNDAKAGTESHTQFLKFLMARTPEDKLKASIASVEATKMYGGTDDGARVFRYTYGSYMLLGSIAGEGKGALGTLYEVMDIKKLPFRKPINELQRIFGPDAPSFNNDEMLHFLDEYKIYLVGGSQDKKKAEKMWNNMRILSQTTGEDIIKFRTYRGLLFGMLYVLLASLNSGVKVAEEGVKSEELGIK